MPPHQVQVPASVIHEMGSNRQNAHVDEHLLTAVYGLTLHLEDCPPGVKMNANAIHRHGRGEGRPESKGRGRATTWDIRKSTSAWRRVSSSGPRGVCDFYGKARSSTLNPDSVLLAMGILIYCLVLQSEKMSTRTGSQGQTAVVSAGPIHSIGSTVKRLLGLIDAMW